MNTKKGLILLSILVTNSHMSNIKANYLCDEEPFKSITYSNGTTIDTYACYEENHGRSVGRTAAMIIIPLATDYLLRLGIEAIKQKKPEIFNTLRNMEIEFRYRILYPLWRILTNGPIDY